MKNSELEAYRSCVTEIDDFFEYSNQSASDKKEVMRIIDKLTDALYLLHVTKENTGP